jgi:hypothetical protein
LDAVCAERSIPIVSAHSKHVIAVAIFFVVAASVGGIRGPGKYTGVVVFDRWGACTLSSGPYVMYVAEAEKGRLREYAGSCVTLVASDVFQPINPGDGLIKKFEVAKPGAGERGDGEPTSPFRISVRLAIEAKHPPGAIIDVENVGAEPATLRYDSLAPTLLVKKKDLVQALSPSDGPSVALMTRQAFWIGGDDEPRLSGGGVSQAVPYRWQVTNTLNLPREQVLAPKEKATIAMTFGVPEGEYDFFAGYRGGARSGETVASNLVAFDVAADGSVRQINVAGR